MIRALWTAATGMAAQQLNVDNTANNLANVNTTGFKKSRVDFQDLLYQTLRPAGAIAAAGAQIPTGIQIGYGSRPVATQKIFTQGDYQQTGNALDLVIEGSGFFQVLMPDGSTAYTRSGSLKMDGDGRLVTSDGYAMEPEISVPEGWVDLSVGTDGTVSVMLTGESSPQEAGTIQLARFTNPAGLKSLGRNLYAATDTSGEAVPGTPGDEGLGTIAQGFLEMSNVNVVEEMVNLITGQRAYEINSRAIQTADEMLQAANSLRR